MDHLLKAAREDIKKSEQHLEDERTKEAKIFLAAVIAENDLPDNATISFFDHVEDSSYDSEVCDVSLWEATVDGNVILDFSEEGYDAQPYGRIGEKVWTLWDDFLNEDGDIVVSKVREYVNLLQNT